MAKPKPTYVLRYAPDAGIELLREFPHGGSAIAWARRKLLSGELIYAELAVVVSDYHGIFEVTTDGLREWSILSGNRMNLGAKVSRLPKVNW